MNWHQSQLNNWADFVELVERLNLNENGDLDWFIRGQSNQLWPLQPSLMRLLGEVSIERALGIEFGATQRFISQYHLHSPADSIDTSKWSQIKWWMTMQHHSCPTRLLDWSLSPYVALYFAVNQFPDSDGAMWFFPSSVLENITESRYGRLQYGSDSQLETNEIKALYPIVAPLHSRRSASQLAVFTICTHVLADHGDVISEAFVEQEDRYPLHKVIVPASLKNEFLSRLRIANITPSALFPDLDGLGRSACDYIRLRAWRTHNEN